MKTLRGIAISLITAGLIGTTTIFWSMYDSIASNRSKNMEQDKIINIYVNEIKGIKEELRSLNRYLRENH